MPIYVTNEKYYRTTEACKAAGISKNTFLRWVKNGLFPDVKYRDRRGWRLFSKEELALLKAEANRVDRKN
jgi:excisionase family DNA binding protein